MKTVMALSFAALLLVGSVHAQGERGNRSRGQQDRASVWEFYSKKYDKDKDGKITAKEYTRPEEAFKRLDGNNDGVLTKDDFAGTTRGRRGRGRGNRRAEMMSKRLFSQVADADKNGTVTAKEWAGFIKSIGGNQNGEVKQEALVDAGFPERMLRRGFTSLDTDGDGKVTTKDFEASFKTLDVDKSGGLEEKELAMSRRGGRGAQGGRGRPGGGRDAQGGGVPKTGEKAPDFKLPLLGKKKATAQLSSFAGKKPVALIFGSYT